jgi:glycolate oxidase iron-sulfur subunit
VLLLQGCVQPTLRPTIDAAAATLLGRLGIATRVVPQAGCCGAIDHHLAAPDAALARMRRNVDAWVPALETGADAIVVTASGCGAMVKEYGHLLRDDPAYAERAARVAAAAVDPAELFRSLDLTPLGRPGNGRRIAFHAPCTLQHGQQLPGVTEALLTALGFELTPVADAHLCCGSAGTYSVLQPELARQLRSNKVAHLEAGEPELIATANIGCLHHLEAGTGTRVVHWLELVTEALDS